MDPPWRHRGPPRHCEPDSSLDSRARSACRHEKLPWWKSTGFFELPYEDDFPTETWDWTWFHQQKREIFMVYGDFTTETWIKKPDLTNKNGDLVIWKRNFGFLMRVYRTKHGKTNMNEDMIWGMVIPPSWTNPKNLLGWMLRTYQLSWSETWFNIRMFKNV